MMRYLHYLTSPIIMVLLAWLQVMPQVASAAESADEVADIIEMPLEELLKLDVYTASRSNTPMRELASAVSVVTAEDIRRSGATSIPEALRAVPGVHVARYDSNKWSVGIRGFSGILSNKLLVMVDGRVIYSPQFSGTWWELHDLVMDDIDRIEVIRGPGASLWGANAVNGVINILTKRASDTRGSHVEAAFGSDEKSVGVRQGWALGDAADLRVYVKGFDRNNVGAIPYAGDSGDWRNTTAGFRLDARPSQKDRLMIEGSAFREFGATAADALALSLVPGMVFASETQRMQGGHLLARWTRDMDKDGELAVQIYHDYTQRQVLLTGYHERINVLDLDMQHSFDLNARNRFTWGLNYRRNEQGTNNTFRFAMTPLRQSVDNWGLFVQDEMRMMDDKLRLTLGSKFEQHYLSGLEIQPSLRAAWLPDQHHTYWAAVSRAVRTPAWLEVGGRANVIVQQAAPPALPLPLVVSGTGNGNFRSEDLLSWEAGYRSQLSRVLSVEASGFYNRYSKLQTLEDRNGCSGATPMPGVETTYLAQYGTANLLCEYQADNNGRATTYGLELAADWRPSDGWRLRTGYTWLHSRMSVRPGSRDIRIEAVEKSDPGNQWYVQSSHDLPRGLTLDWTLRHVGALPGMGVSAYEALDAKLSWKPRPGLELALVGRNLNDASHQESNGSLGLNLVALPVVRDVFATVKLDF